jgi:hypothetical protein
MRFVGVAFSIACTWWPILTAAEASRIGDTTVCLSLGGGHSEAVSGSGIGGAKAAHMLPALPAPGGAEAWPTTSS